MVEEFFAGLIQSFGYLGIFLVSLISSSSIIFPIPGAAVIFAAGAAFNPIGVAVAAGLGASFGEMTGYWLGWGSKKTVMKKYRKEMGDMKDLFKRWGGDFVVFAFAVLPVPFDVIGIFCGHIDWGTKRFLAATIPGKVLKFLVVAYAGYYAVGWLSLFI
jgi:membrane protein YqaA with SNARE-associated domain